MSVGLGCGLGGTPELCDDNSAAIFALFKRTLPFSFFYLLVFIAGKCTGSGESGQEKWNILNIFVVVVSESSRLKQRRTFMDFDSEPRLLRFAAVSAIKCFFCVRKSIAGRICSLEGFFRSAANRIGILLLLLLLLLLLWCYKPWCYCGCCDGIMSQRITFQNVVSYGNTKTVLTFLFNGPSSGRRHCSYWGSNFRELIFGSSPPTISFQAFCGSFLRCSSFQRKCCEFSVGSFNFCDLSPVTEFHGTLLLPPHCNLLPLPLDFFLGGGEFYIRCCPDIGLGAASDDPVDMVSPAMDVSFCQVKLTCRQPNFKHGCMGAASWVAGGNDAPCTLCPAPRLPPSRREKKNYVPSRPFPSVVAA